MKQEPAPKSHRIAALFAAAAFLPTPLLAQDTTSTQQTPPVLTDPSPPVTTTPPIVVSPPPVAAEVPPVSTAPPPVQAPRAPLLTDPLPANEPAVTSNTRSARTARAARTAPAAPRAAPRLRAEPSRAAAPARPAPVQAPAPIAAAPAPLPAEAMPPADAPAAVPPAAATSAPPAAQSEGGSNWLWLLIPAALLLGALALFARRRRRAGSYEQERYEQPAYAGEPVAYEPDQVHAPAAAATVGAAAGAAAAEQGRPWLELLMRPVRAGVEGQDAIVEFELSVDNQGSAPARDVRVSTWMFPAGAAQESEAERMLIDRSSEASLPELTLAPGDAKRIATAVALPTGGLTEDAVLPVVVADARYVLPDGSEGRTSVSYAVGVPDGEELAHFAIDNPSGLHEDVEARPLGEPERA